MTQSLTDALAEHAEAAVKADHWERDQQAWNLPRGTAEHEQPSDRDQLGWDRFVATYFPGSRRHDLKAIVAYAAYRNSGDVPSAGRGADPQAEGR